MPKDVPVADRTKIPVGASRPRGSLTTTEAAEAWGTTPAQVRAWILLGRVPAVAVHEARGVAYYVTSRERPELAMPSWARRSR